MLFNSVIKVFSFLISLFTIPAYLFFFSNEQTVGIWLTLLSTISFFINFDFGLGNGLRNKLVKPIADKDFPLIIKWTLNTVFFEFIISLLITLIIGFFLFIVDWNDLLNIPLTTVDKETLFWSLFILLISTSTFFVLRVVTFINHAFQLSFINGLIQFSSSLMLLIFTLSVKFISIKETFLYISFFYFFSTNIPLFINFILYYFINRKKFTFNISIYDKNIIKTLLSTGFHFFLIQISHLIINGTNEILINLNFDSTSVYNYNVYGKFFFAVLTFSNFLLSPLWASIASGYTTNDKKWISRILKLSFYFFVLTTFILITIAFSLQFILDIWLESNSIQIDSSTTILFVFLLVFSIGNLLLSSFSNGFNEIYKQSILLIIGAIIKIPLSFYFMNLFSSWNGVLLANVFAFFPFLFIQPFYVFKIYKKFKYQNSNPKLNT